MEKLTYYRPTTAFIDLDAIRQNVQSLKQHLQAHVQIIAVVKANGYGHGDVEVARAAIEAGATVLAVATADEAVHLRQHFETIDILVLGATPHTFLPFAAANNISLTVFSSQWIIDGEPLFEGNVKLHIKIDSGMGRIGVTSSQQLLDLYEAIAQSSKFVVEGVFTHFATADEEDELYFEKQATMFKELVETLPQKPNLVHAANTATALIKDPTLQFDAVRFGISMYGLAPSAFVEQVLPFKLKRAFTLETELVHVKQFKAGQSIGYGATYTATKDCYIGTLPIGYADGMLRKLGGQEVLVDGKRAPIVGRICMDQCMILLPNELNVGERVVLIGEQGKHKITLDDWAEKLETINYEVPCVITARVPRKYI